MNILHSLMRLLQRDLVVNDMSGESNAISLTGILEGKFRGLRAPTDLAFPEVEGISHTSAAELFASHRRAIDQALRAFEGRSQLDGFSELFLQLVYNVACELGTLPASRTYHHSYRGGLFQHSLSVALSALHVSLGTNVTFKSSPRERAADQLAWQLTVFCAGILHDIGKIHTIGTIQAIGVNDKKEGQGGYISSSAPLYDTIWNPTVENFEEWAVLNSVTSYSIDYAVTPYREHTGYTERYVTRIIPRKLLAFIYKSNPQIVQMFEDFLRNPHSPSNSHLFSLIKNADHSDVSESMHPKKKPGAMGLSGLLKRRLTEFSHEETWNLPTSPFLRAHVKVSSGSEDYYMQLPFFVATPENVQKFIQFVLQHDLFGVTITERSEVQIFNALEVSALFNKTIPAILPQQIPLKDNPEHIPASLANVMFSAVRTQSTLTEGPADTKPAILQLPVISISGNISSGKTNHMPTLSFYDVPTFPVVESNSVVIFENQILPEDPAQEHDPAYMEKLFQIMNDFDIPKDAAVRVAKTVSTVEQVEPVEVSEEILEIGRNRERKPVNLAKPSSGELGEDTQNISQQNPINTKIKKDNKEQQPSSQRVAPTGAPKWLRIYCLSGEIEPHCLWASVWVYFKEFPIKNDFCIERDGIYSFKTHKLDQDMRNKFMEVLRKNKTPLDLVIDHWPVGGMSHTEKGFEENFVKKPKSIMLAHSISDLIGTFEGEFE